jgi:hypothetical protein
MFAVPGSSPMQIGDLWCVCLSVRCTASHGSRTVRTQALAGTVDEFLNLFPTHGVSLVLTSGGLAGQRMRLRING